MLNLLNALILDQPDQPDDLATNEDFAEEQTLVARLINLMQAETADQQFLVPLPFYYRTLTSYSVSVAERRT